MNSSWFSLDGSFTANSTTPVGFAGFGCAFFSYWEAAKIWDNKASSWTSPIVPAIFTEVNALFKPLTSFAIDCISPNPFWTDSNCLLTSSKEEFSLFSNVDCNFSSTVSLICSNFFSLLSWISFKLVWTVSFCLSKDSCVFFNFSSTVFLTCSNFCSLLFWISLRFVWIVSFCLSKDSCVCFESVSNLAFIEFWKFINVSWFSFLEALSFSADSLLFLSNSSLNPFS